MTTKKPKPEPKFGAPGITQDLIDDACRAEEMFDLDELEAFADEQARKREQEQP